MTLTRQGYFGYAGGGKNGAEVDAWYANRFSTLPAEGTEPPGPVPDAGPVISGVEFGGPGAYELVMPAVADYFIRAQYGGNSYWFLCSAGTIAGQTGNQFPIPVLNGVADNGITDNAPSFNSQLALLHSLGYSKVQLAAAPSAYGIGPAQLQIPPGMWVDGAGPLTFKFPPTTSSLASGDYYGTALCPASNWTDPGFDSVQAAVTMTGGSATVLCSTASQSWVGKPVTGYNVTTNPFSQPVYVQSVVTGTSITLTAAPVGNGTLLTIGTNLPLGALVTLQSSSPTTNVPGSGARITNVTINGSATPDHPASQNANLGLWMAGDGCAVENVLFLDGNMACLATPVGAGAGSAQDSLISRCCFNNRQYTSTHGVSQTNLALNTGIANTGALLTGVTTTVPAMLAGAVGPQGNAGGYNGAKVEGSGILANTFIAPGGINANGADTLLLTRAPGAGFTGNDLTIITADMVGCALRTGSSDIRVFDPLMQNGTFADCGGGDMNCIGGNIFGSSQNGTLLNPTAATLTNPSGQIIYVATAAAATYAANGFVAIYNSSNNALNGVWPVSATDGHTYVEFLFQGTVPAISGTYQSGTQWVGQVDYYCSSSANSGGNSQFTGTVWGPGGGGSGGGGGSFIRLDSSGITFTGGLYEMNNMSMAIPLIEDNLAPSSGIGQVNMVGATLKYYTKGTGISSIISDRSGTPNARSHVDATIEVGCMAGPTYFAPSAIPDYRINVAGVGLFGTLPALTAIQSTVTAGGAAPTVVADAAAGTGAAATITGNDLAGVVSLTSGSGSLAAGAQVTVTFNQVKAAAPTVVMLTTQGSGSGRVIVQAANVGTTGFSINAAVLATTTSYEWAYLVIE